MAHAVFTIVTPVRPEAELDLRLVLDTIQNDPSANPFLRFPALDGLHFASFTIFDDEPAPTGRGRLPTVLVLEINGDGTVEQWLDRLARPPVAAGIVAPGLMGIYQHCTNSPGIGASPEAIRAYLADHHRLPNLHHVGRPYRRADTVRADRDLRRVLDRAVDTMPSNPPPSPVELWARLRTTTNAPTSPDNDLSPNVDAQGHVSWVPRPEHRWPVRLRRWFVAALLLVLALAIKFTIIRVNWLSQSHLTIGLSLIYAVHGVFTAVLLGWPASHRWRDPVNLTVWFAAIGCGVSLMPAAVRLSGLEFSWLPAWISQLAMAVLSVAALAFLVGEWALPTPELARPTASSAQRDQVTAQEDRGVTNHMSAMVILRPGVARRMTLRLLLWLLEHVWFHTVLSDVFRGRLFEFATVHFAQWVVLDERRYLFLSNYDHSWSRYLDDFGNIAYGLARLWGQADQSPGLSDLERFKAFARTWMRPYAVWYQAVPNMTVTQVWTNEQLRQGLLRPADDSTSRQLLQRLVNAEERS